MKIGVNLHRSLLTPLEPRKISGVLQGYSDLGVEFVEVPGEISAASREGAIAHLLKSYSFEYSVHAPLDVDVLSTLRDDKQLKRLLESFKLAYRIEAEVVVLHPSTKSPNPRLEEFREAMSKLTKLAREYNLVLALENLQPGDRTGRFYRVEELLDLLSPIEKSHSGIVLDTGHLYLSSKFLRFSFARSIRLALKRLVHVHLSDNYGRISRRERSELDPIRGIGDLHLPPGSGSVPNRRAVKTLRESGFNEALVVDIKPQYLGLLLNSIRYVKRVLF